MPSRFVCFSLALFGSALLLTNIGRAQQAASPTPAVAQTPSTNAAAAAKPVDPSSHAMATAIGLMNANNVDGALAKLTEAIQLNPKNSAAYVLRASVYCQKSLWPQAEADFKTASDLAPGNVVLKFNIVTVKFMQKQYDAARPGYVALEGDPDMGDFASYNVFLCDLAAGHTDLAKKELDAFDTADTNASYYFGNAAWSIAHKNYDDARSWLTSASNIYPPRKSQYYAESLIYLGYLPLPKDPNATTH